MNDLNSTMIEKIYNMLKKQIINLEFKFNQKLNVKEMAQQFGVSQTPVRDALNNLVKDELVVVKPRIGYFVLKLTKKDLYEIFEVRKMLECFALENSVNLNYKKFKKYYEKTLEIKDRLSKYDNYDEFNILDRDVHSSIIEESGNMQLIKMFFHIYSFVQISQNFDRGKRSLKEIDSIILLLEKILNKDIFNAKTILQEHLENCKIIGIESLKNYNIK